MIIQSTNEPTDLSITQRWSHALVVMLAVIVFLYGISSRDQFYNNTTFYENVQAGISAFYPNGWLLDAEGDYVFRVRDLKNNGYSTTIQLTTLPASPELTTRNLIDLLALQRAQIFTDYTILNLGSVQLANDASAQTVLYTYVTRETNPLLEGIPSVVIGYDILTLRRGQAIVITFRADSNQYQDEFRHFEQFLASLRF